MATGIPDIDALLFRGGLHPGNFVILGGRMHTRKTAVALNIIVHMLRSLVPVALVSLDEALPMYVAKLTSVLSRVPAFELEANWDSPGSVRHREAYAELAKGLCLTVGTRPLIDDLDSLMAMSDITYPAPRVVVIDYLALMGRADVRESESQRIPRLFEDLQVWAKEQQVVLIAVHQVGRTEEGASKRYHGDTPMTAESLMYGGEQTADIILGTYRPALSPLGNMTQEMAEMVLGDKFDFDKWDDQVKYVRTHKNDTFLQLLKNRPSEKGLLQQGVKLKSPDQSQYMVAAADRVGQDSVLRGVG